MLTDHIPPKWEIAQFIFPGMNVEPCMLRLCGLVPERPIQFQRLARRFNRAGLGPQLIPVSDKSIQINLIRATHRPKPSVACRIFQIVIAVTGPNQDASPTNIL